MEITVIKAGIARIDEDIAMLRDHSEEPNELDRLRLLANRCRQVLLDMIHQAGSGHIGSSLSCVDIISVLKFDQMDWRATTPRMESDVFVLSKGHAAPAWYAALIVSGDIDSAHAATLRRIDSPFQGHPDRVRCELVDVSTGALGQGLSVALGRAQGKRLRNRGRYVYCIVGDGECQEGQVWEALMYGGARRLSNVVLFIDHNQSQNDGSLEGVLPLGALVDKLRAFDWHVQEVDGHSHADLRRAVLRAKANFDQPSVIVAQTLKGYLGAGRVLLDGAHSGSLSDAEMLDVNDYLLAQS